MLLSIQWSFVNVVSLSRSCRYWVRVLKSMITVWTQPCIFTISFATPVLFATSVPSSVHSSMPLIRNLPTSFDRSATWWDFSSFSLSLSRCSCSFRFCFRSSSFLTWVFHCFLAFNLSFCRAFYFLMISLTPAFSLLSFTFSVCLSFVTKTAELNAEPAITLLSIAWV